MKPTCEELWNEELEEVYRSSKTGWRHGTTESTVFYRESDETYWKAIYQLSTDSETNDLRDGYAIIRQVVPKQVITVIYEDIVEESIPAQACATPPLV